MSVQAVNQASAAGQTEKTIQNTSYKTVQNSGTVTFTRDSIIAKGLGYTANWTSTGAEYLNGVFLDSLNTPFSFTYPPTNTSAKYDVIGKDSLLFHGGYLVQGLGGGNIVAPPNGGRFSFKGDTLFLISKVNQNTTQSANGATITSTASGTVTLAFVKK